MIAPATLQQDVNDTIKIEIAFTMFPRCFRNTRWLTGNVEAFGRTSDLRLAGHLGQG